MLVLPWNSCNDDLSAQTSKLCRSRTHIQLWEEVLRRVGVGQTEKYHWISAGKALSESRRGLCECILLLRSPFCRFQPATSPPREYSISVKLLGRTMPCSWLTVWDIISIFFSPFVYYLPFRMDGAIVWAQGGKCGHGCAESGGGVFDWSKDSEFSNFPPRYPWILWLLQQSQKTDLFMSS